MTLIQREYADSEQIKGICKELSVALENAIKIMERLYERYKIGKDRRVQISLVMKQNT